jgi:parvulin-like peptidyl-prolyl isomerase
MKKIKLDKEKIFSRIKPNGIKQVFGRIGNFFQAVGAKVNWGVLTLPVTILFVLAAITEIVFGVIIFGFKIDNKATQVAAKIIPFPIAVANWDFISYNDYLKERDYIHHFYEATKQEEINFKEIDGQIADQLIENKLVKSEALKNNVKVDQADVDAAINSIIEQNGGKDKVEGVLKDLYGLTLKDFTKLVKIQLLRDKLNDTMIVKIDARHILIRVDQDAPQEKVDVAKAKIDGIVQEIKSGLDFGEAAKKYSEDIGSADQGGKLEPFSKGEMVDSFSDAAFATKAGEISAPIRSEFGWHIIKIENRTGKVEKKFSEWLDGIRSKSLIIKFYEI